MRYHTLLSLLAITAYASPLLQLRDNAASLDDGKDFDKAYKQMGKAYDTAMKEYSKAAGKSSAEFGKAYSEYAKAAGNLADDACKCEVPKASKQHS